jgi:hypothetical protein
MEHSIYEISFVVWSVLPNELAFSILFAICKLTYIFLVSILPYLSASAMLLIIFPLTIIHATHYVSEYALAISFILMELSHVVFSIHK